jgi:hypothetical protein
MTQQVTRVRVFVASPGDVQPEGNSLHSVIEELNTTLGQRFGFIIELVGWETHCQPAMGRPQAVINEQIGEYDIFVGIMWKRFGMPTGEADSGTEEEFNLAYTAWQRDNTRQVTFYFSQALYTLNSAEEVEQIAKVIAFKKELMDKGLVWEYPMAGKFPDVIRPHLSRSLLKMFPIGTAAEAGASVVDRTESPAEAPDEQLQQAADVGSTGRTTEVRETGQRQIVDFVGALDASVNREDFARGSRFSDDLDDFQLLRLQLLTSAWLITSIPGSTLGIQEANRLYLYRDKLRPTGPEFVSLLRTLLNDQLNYIPGWYWFRSFEERDVQIVILDLAFSDPHNVIRQRAFEQLAAARVPLADSELDRMARSVSSDSSDVRTAALAYIGSSAGAAYLPLVGSALVDREKRVVNQANLSRYLILARTEPDRAFGELLGLTGVRAEDVLKELRPRAAEIATTNLLRASDHANDEIRFFTIQELIRRGEFTVELATSRKDDKYDQVKAAAYKFLIERGIEIDDAEIAWDVPRDHYRRLAGRALIFQPEPPIEREEILLAFYQRYDKTSLMQMACWDRLAGHEAYRALAIQHFTEFAVVLRDNLRTEFAAAGQMYYQTQLEEWRRIETGPINRAYLESPSLTLSLLSGLQHKPEKRDASTPESVAQSDVERRKVYYIAAALAGLARYGSPEDADFGRQFLSHSDMDVRIEAVRVIQRCGNGTDVPSLIKTAKGSDGLVQELAAKAVFVLTVDQKAVAGEFLKTENEILTSITIAELIARDDIEQVSDFLKPYLYTEQDKLRTRVMAYFIFRYDEQQLTDLLTWYTSADIYYFDVVCCFDRMLFAPLYLKSSYRESVKDTLFGFVS